MLHYTIVFQVFVFLQIFNLINARKIGDDEMNVFKGFFDNKMFIIVFVLTIVIQCLLIEVGGQAVKTWPLNTTQNVICLSIGFGSLIWGFILKFIPLRFFQCITLDDKVQTDEDGNEKKSQSVMGLKRLST